MKRTRLKPVSDKRRQENKEYVRIKKLWRSLHDGRCEMLFEAGAPHVKYPRIDSTQLLKDGPPPQAIRCRASADQCPHHLRLRGRYLSVIGYFCGLCKPHHDWCHQFPNEARRLGYLIRP